MSYYPTQVATAIPPTTDFNLPPPAAVEGLGAPTTGSILGWAAAGLAVLYFATRKKGRK